MPPFKHLCRYILPCLLACGLLATGCQKQRIYATPPGATPVSEEHAPATTTAQPSPAPTASTSTTVAPETTSVAQKSEPTSNTKTAALPSETNQLTGRAGILDDELIGFPMAGGGSYDPESLVAGHRTLPLGSRVEVTMKTTGARTVVTITDRGPFDKSRVLDLSRKAAKVLEITSTAEVSLRVLSADKAETAKQKAPLEGALFVQIGAYSDQANAQAVLDAIVKKGMRGSRVIRPKGDTFTRVLAGPFKDRDAAEQALASLRNDYPASFIIRPD
ncbi:MAG: SPOR domain-containing protein [Proteobacteria bacterium]|nr:SPOR domain-containing protein [Pseudomonadota bacterium]